MLSPATNPQISSTDSTAITSVLPLRVGMLLMAIVFPLIWAGGLVTTYDAGMAVPDWPGTYGYNMFAYPLSTWWSGPWDLFVEHGHRLLGSLAGIVAIGLVMATFWKEHRKWVRVYSVVLLALVIVQGMLGGFRVLLDDRLIARIHGCVGPAFFAASAGFCVVTSRWWHRQSAPREEVQLQRRFLFNWPIIMLAACYCQLVIGACFRHIAIGATPNEFRVLVLAHVVLAIAIVFGTLFHMLTIYVARRSAAVKNRGLTKMPIILTLLIIAQFLLGLGSWVVKWGWPAWFADLDFAAGFVIGEKEFWQMNLVTAHVAIGSLLLAVWTAHAIRCQRVFSPAWIGKPENPDRGG